MGHAVSWARVWRGKNRGQELEKGRDATVLGTFFSYPTYLDIGYINCTTTTTNTSRSDVPCHPWICLPASMGVFFFPLQISFSKFFLFFFSLIALKNFAPYVFFFLLHELGKYDLAVIYTLHFFIVPTGFSRWVGSSHKPEGTFELA